MSKSIYLFQKMLLIDDTFIMLYVLYIFNHRKLSYFLKKKKGCVSRGLVEVNLYLCNNILNVINTYNILRMINSHIVVKRLVCGIVND